jgi:hypothetical protein
MSQKTRAVSQLVRKEFHLQRSNLLFTFAVVCFWGILRLLSTATRTQTGFGMAEIIAGIHVFGVLSCLVVLLPLMYGATTIAGERQLGVLDWQLAAPVSRTLQVAIKAGVASLLAAISGGVIAVVLDLMLPSANVLIPGFRHTWPGVYSMLLACLGLFSSSLLRDAYRALLLGGSISMAIAAISRFADVNGIAWPLDWGGYPDPLVSAGRLTTYVLLLALTVVLLALPWFRPMVDRRIRLLWQAPVLCMVVIVLTCWAVHLQRAVPLASTSPQISWYAPVPSSLVTLYKDDSVLSAPEKLASYGRHHFVAVATQQHFFSTMGQNWSEVAGREVRANLQPIVLCRDTWSSGRGRAQLDCEPWRSPAGKLVSYASFENVRNSRVLLEADVERSEYRQFTEATGELLGWGTKAGYVTGNYTWGRWTNVGDSLFAKHVQAGDVQPWRRTTSSSRPAPGPGDKFLPLDRTGMRINDAVLWRAGAQNIKVGAQPAPIRMLGKSGLAAAYVQLMEPSPRGKLVSVGTECLFRVDSATSEAKLIETNSDMRNFLAADASSRWCARGRFVAGGAADSVDVFELRDNGTTTGRHFELCGKMGPTTATAQQLWQQMVNSSLTSVTLCRFMGDVYRSGDDTLTPWSIGADYQGALHISPDGKYLAYMLVTLGRIDLAGETQRLVPVWYEVRALNLNTGADQVLGGFQPNELVWDVDHRHRNGTMLTDEAWLYASSALHRPVFEWTPDGRLAVLDSSLLYLMDMNAAKSDNMAAPPFQKFNVSMCDAQDFAVWQENLLVLWGERAIWKMQLTPEAGTKAGTGRQLARSN